MNQAPLFLFLPLIWPAVHMLKNLITVPSRKGLRCVQHSSMAFGVLLPLLSPTEEPAHLVWSCAIASGKGSSMSVCPSFFSRWIQLHRVIPLPHRPSWSSYLSSATTQDLSAYWYLWQQMDTHRKAYGGERCAQSLPSWKITNPTRSTKNS